jgi:hypothetical protein
MVFKVYGVKIQIDEQVVFVREWKRLHYSNADRLSGHEIKPFIEQMPEECRHK